MSFRVEAIRGAEHGGTVDYRLARAGVLAEYRKGRLARHEVCDAHPELLRAARDYIEESTQLDCPVCEEEKLKLVSYVFGSYLGPGRALRAGPGGAGQGDPAQGHLPLLRGRGVSRLWLEPLVEGVRGVTPVAPRDGNIP